MADDNENDDGDVGGCDSYAGDNDESAEINVAKVTNNNRNE